MNKDQIPKLGLSHVFVVVGLALLAIDVAPGLYSSAGKTRSLIADATAQTQDNDKAGADGSQREADRMCGVTAGTCWNDTEYAILTDLQAKAQENQREARRVAAAREDLEAARQALSERIERVEDLRADLVERLEARRETAREDIQRLARIYANMRPEKAANMMNKLSLTTAADIVQRIPTEDAAAIMAQMDAEPGSRLTRELNRRRKMVKGEAPVRQDGGGDGA